MPFICIGPVCIPWSALLPVIVYLGRPVWNRLPPPVQKQLTEYANAFTDWMQANVWDAIGWKAKAEKPKLAAGPAPTAGGLRAQLGSVIGVHSEAEWEAAIALTKERELVAVVDFTAEWCGPCQAIKPFYTELAAKHKDAALFLKVDVDEMDDIAQEAGVAAMPTFMAYKGGAKIDTITGARKDALEKMVLKAIAPVK